MQKSSIFTVLLFSIATACADDCNPNFACADLTLTGNISPAVPIIYRPGSGWENSSELQDTIAFGDFDATSAPQTIEYPITLGTLDSNPSAGLYFSAVSSNPVQNQYFTLNNNNLPANHIPYVVSYTGCNSSDAQNTQNITPNGAATTQTVFFPQAVTGMAGSDSACHPSNDSTPGSGAGKLIFSLVKPVAGVFAAGEYQDTLTITVCTSNPCI